ncbi:DUF3800 domain-containing protein [Terrabacter sp. NPDC000476]|uniref:DUF3800 domain-containing protein n=1 Tax=Terrabacter sp. NPDC000476 TaxID=3154258 RepID=UPI003317443A
MLLAYIDESGDSGQTNGSNTYTLGCVLVRDTAWPDVFDNFLQFRRFVRARFGILLRDEIKANYLLRGGGDLKRFGFGEGIRHDIYRMHMRLAPKLGLQVFAVVIDKTKIQVWRNPRDIAWGFLLQRLERMSTKSGEPIMVIHDEGDSHAIRGLARKARRANTPGSAFGVGHLSLPARLILDDPVPRNSSQSFFIQLADLSAYAAFRTVFPPNPKRATVCPPTMWGELGDARFADANKLATGVLARTAEPGVVVWPT